MKISNFQYIEFLNIFISPLFVIIYNNFRGYTPILI